MPFQNSVNGFGVDSNASLNAFKNFQGALDQYLPSSNYLQETATPEYMVKMDSLLESTVKDFEDYIQAYHFAFSISRFTNPNAAHQQYSSSRVQFENPVLVIPNGRHTPDLINKLISGILVEEIKFCRLQNIADVNQKGEEISFKKCYFQVITPKYDVLLVSFRFTEYSHSTTSYDQSGTSKGNNVVTYNMGTGEHSVQG